MIPEGFFMIQTRTRFVTRMQDEEDISQLCTFQCLMSSVLIVIFRDLNSLIDFFSFTTWIFYTLAFASYFALRYKEPHAQRPFRVRIVGLLILLYTFGTRASRLAVSIRDAGKTVVRIAAC